MQMYVVLVAVSFISLYVSFRLMRQPRVEKGQPPPRPNKTRFVIFLAVMLSVMVFCVYLLLNHAGAAGALRDKEMHRLRDEAIDLREKGKTAEATAAAAKALAMAKESLEAGDQRQVGYLVVMADCLKAEKKHAEAEPHLKKALAIRSAEHGADSPQAGEIENELGLLCFEAGRYEEAEAYYKKALLKMETVLGQIPPGLPKALDNLGNLCEKLGRAEEAARYRERAKGFRFDKPKPK